VSDLFHTLQLALADAYQLERELGRGGMATVYLARDLKHHRHVAIKVLRPELAGVMTRGRFLREIRISSELTHPNILPLLDSGMIPATDQLPALPYFTMPYVAGETLAGRLGRERQLPLEEARQIATEVAAALGHAHAHGVIHRDIKPGNILLMDGHAVVADFGIARAVKESVDPDAVTSAGLVIGTPAYMSPEQAGGDQGLDGRSDLYSLGCVLYEMLGGEPPFTGPTPQAVLARHRMDQPQSLRTLRTTVPVAVEQAIMKALQKSPADRFATTHEFIEAFDRPPTLESQAGATRSIRRRVALVGVALVTAALLAWRMFRPEAPPLATNKVVVFPLGETPAGALQEGTGAVVALMIGSALEYTDPLVWIDGEPRLGPAERRDPNVLATEEAGRIAKQAGARWFLDGSVVRRGDSVTVVLRLNDAGGDSVVTRASATRVTAEAAQAGLAAVNQVLPRLLSPGQKLTALSALADRRPAAVALWLQGEREYRSFNFARALEFDQRAIEEDSSLAVAAIRGAQAASWLNEFEEAGALADVALRHVALLPGRLAPFTRGLHAYLGGQPDSAVRWLTQALQASPEWTEAHMALGEVHYHLLPSTAARSDSLAEAEFAAAAADSGFSPAWFHLAEIAILSGDTVRAGRAVLEFLERAQAGPSSDQRLQLLLMLDCVRSGRAGVKWQALAAHSPLVVLSAAMQLAGNGGHPGCAEDGFRAVFSDSTVSLAFRWGGFLGLQGVLASEQRVADLRAVIASAGSLGLDQAEQLYVLDALAGVGVGPDAASVVARRSTYGASEPPEYALWLAGEWEAQAGNLAATERAREALVAGAARRGDAAMAPWAEVLAARVVLLQGDTTAAIDRLRSAIGAVPQVDLDWGIRQSLAPDRMLLAELWLARGRPREAIAAASVFDHHVPVVFLPFLPSSLALRRKAALALGHAEEAELYARRLAALRGGT